ncbi:hypothetical protein ACFX1W_046493 [Malus domestica]
MEPRMVSNQAAATSPDLEEREPKEWVAQEEPEVLITFGSLPRGGNDLKSIRCSREVFNTWQAQRSKSLISFRIF